MKKARRPKFSEKRQNVVLIQDRISNTSKYELRPALRARRITPYSRNIQPIPTGAYIINFGASKLPIPRRGDLRILNTPEAIAVSSNKLESFRKLSEANVPCVKWTVDKEKAGKWIGRGYKVLARTNLSSSGGRGIRILGAGSDIPEAPLYTRYFPKTHEFRVHVVRGEVIDLVEKKLRDSLREERQDRTTIRNHYNGWVFAHDNLSVTEPADIAALNALGCAAIKAIGLDFGAVDILAILDEGTPRRLKNAVVCEVNSAPGIENTKTLEAYTRAFNRIINNQG